MKVACGDPHSNGGLSCPRRHSRFFPARSNRYIISALLARSDDRSFFILPVDVFRSADAALCGPCCRVPRRAAGAGRRPTGRHGPPCETADLHRFHSCCWLKRLARDQHGPCHAGILGGDGDDRLAEADALPQSDGPAAHPVSFGLCMGQHGSGAQDQQ